LIGSNWTSNLEKPNAIIQSLCSRDRRRFYDYSPEFADQKSEGLSNNLWSGVQLLWSDDKQSDGFIRRDAAKK
jgi:hypothetical protein